MAQLLIRDIEPAIIKRLKLRAKHHHRSLQGELKSIVESATKMTMVEAKRASRAWQKRLQGQSYSDSAALLRAERDR